MSQSTGTRTNLPDKSDAYPWKQFKLGGNPHNVLPRYGHAAFPVVSADTLVLFGGVHSKGRTEDLLYIDINTMTANNTPTTGDIPSSRLRPIFAPQGDTNVLYYGGEPTVAGDKWDPHFYTLSLSSGQWTRLQTADGRLPSERTGHSGAMAGTTLIVWGGRHGDQYLNDMFALDTSTFVQDTHWDYITANNDGPSKRAGHASIVYDNHLYIFGGTDGNHIYNDIWSFDLQTRYWTKVSATGFIPKPREGCSAALVGDVMYVFGGKGPDGQFLADLAAFKIRGSRWFMFQHMGPGPTPRTNLTFSVMQDKIYSVGGEAQSTGDPFVLHVLDCSKIRYPPETSSATAPRQPSPIRTSPSPYVDPTMQRNHPVHMKQPPESHQHHYKVTETHEIGKRNNTESPTNRQSQYPETSKTAPKQADRHTSTVPEAALRRPRATSPMPKTEPASEPQTPRPTGLPSPQTPTSTTSETVYTYSSNRSLTPTSPDKYHSTSPGVPVQKAPPRPPRAARENTKSSAQPIRQNTVSMYPVSYSESGTLDQKVNHSLLMANMPTISPSSTVVEGRAITPTQSKEASDNVAPEEDLSDLIQEVKARDQVIANMKKLETWWRNEVMIARRMKSATGVKGLDETVEEDEHMLLDLGEHLSDEKLHVFEQLLALKAELRRVKASISGPASSKAMTERIGQAEMMRTASLQETAYFKSKYLALLGRRPDLILPETRRVQELERQLTAVLAENESSRKQIATLNKNNPHDQAARESANERAQDALERAKQAQEACERTVEKLEEARKRVSWSENQMRDNAVKIAELTEQLAHALSSGVVSSQVTEAQSTITQLEATNAKIHAQSATLQTELAACMDEVSHLREALEERQKELDDATKRLETMSAEVQLMNQTMSEKGMATELPPARAY